MALSSPTTLLDLSQSPSYVPLCAKKLKNELLRLLAIRFPDTRSLIRCIHARLESGSEVNGGELI